MLTGLRQGAPARTRRYTGRAGIRGLRRPGMRGLGKYVLHPSGLFWDEVPDDPITIPSLPSVNYGPELSLGFTDNAVASNSARSLVRSNEAYNRELVNIYENAYKVYQAGQGPKPEPPDRFFKLTDFDALYSYTSRGVETPNNQLSVFDYSPQYHHTIATPTPTHTSANNTPTTVYTTPAPQTTSTTPGGSNIANTPGGTGGQNTGSTNPPQQNTIQNNTPSGGDFNVGDFLQGDIGDTGIPVWAAGAAALAGLLFMGMMGRR